MCTRKCMNGLDMPSSKTLNLRGEKENLFNLIRDCQTEIIQNLKSDCNRDKSSKWKNKKKITTEKQGNDIETPLRPEGRNSSRLLNSDKSNAASRIPICHNKEQHPNVRSLSSLTFDEDESEGESHVRDGFATTSEPNKSLPHSIKLENFDSKLDINKSLSIDGARMSESSLNNYKSNSTKEPTPRVKAYKYSTQKETSSQDPVNNENLKVWENDDFFTRNPITGAITHFNKNKMWKPMKVVGNDDKDGIHKNSISKYSETLDNFVYSKRPGKISQHRNPITGEGITDDMNHYKFMPRGIRVTQPPGGTCNFPNI